MNVDAGLDELSRQGAGTVEGSGVECQLGSKRILLLSVLVFAACGGGNKGIGPGEEGEPNRAPAAVEDIADQEMILGEGAAKVDLSGTFRDGDGDKLTFSAVSSDESVAAVSISSSTLTVESVSPGDATITVTATDPGGLSATRRFRVYVEALDPNLTGPYETLDWISVTPGRVVWRPVSSLPLSCLGWTEATVNGVTYRIHFSHWQKSGGSARAWTDIPGTRRVRRMCGYTPTSSGEYRLVMELSINGVRGRYASSNVIIAICDGVECRYFQL